MPTLKRPRVALIPCACQFCLLAVIALWSHRLSRQYLLGFFTPAGHLRAIATDRQGLMLFSTNVPFDPAMGLSAKAMSARASDVDELHEYLFGSTFEKWKHVGFHLADGTIAFWPWTFDAWIVPYWVMLVLLAIPPWMAARRFLARVRRRRGGQCLVCGYDLRQSPVRCPECGTPIHSDLDSASDSSIAPGSVRRRFAIKRFIKLSAAAALIGCGCALFGRGRETARRMDLARAEEAAGMHRHVSEFRFRGRFADAIQSLQNQTGVTIRLDVSAQRLRDRPIDIHLFDVELGPALRSLLEEATDRDPDALEACPVGGTILVAAPNSLPRFVRLYAVGDLLAPKNAAIGTSVSGQPAASPHVQRELLENLLAHFVRPDSWANSGGAADEMAWANVLAVYQTSAAHVEVQALLDVARGKTTNAPPGPASEFANLNTPIEDLEFNGTLTDAIDTLRDATRTNIVVRPEDFFSNDYLQANLVHMRLRNSTAGRALRALFYAVGPTNWMALVSQDGIARVVWDRDGSPKNTFLRTYDIRDIIADAVAFDEAHPWMSPVGQTNTLFSGDLTPAEQVPVDLITLIEENVDSETWKGNGGTINDPFEFNGRLFIQQTAEAHHDIAALLPVIRKGGSPDGSPIILTPSKGFVRQPAAETADMGQPIAEFNVDSTFGHAIQELQQVTHTNIVIYWADLAAADVRPSTPLKVHLWNTTLERALGVLISLAGSEGQISYGASDAAIVVGFPRRFAPPVDASARFYDVRDMIDQLLAYDKSKNPSSGAAGVTQPMTVEDAVESLDRLIEDTILPDSWKDNGGNFGSLREFDGRLMITQTPEAHRRLAALLHALRAAGARDGSIFPSSTPVGWGEGEGETGGKTK